MPIILPEKHHDAWLSFESEKQFSLCFNSGRSTQKRIAPHPKKYGAIQSNYITNISETYEEIEESFHYLTHQTGDPDMVRF